MRAAVLEGIKSFDLARCSTFPRVVEGEYLSSGYTFTRLMVGADFKMIYENLAAQIGGPRLDRFNDWVEGKQIYSFGRVEQMQLSDDINAVQASATNGGYGFMLSRKDD